MMAGDSILGFLRFSVIILVMYFNSISVKTGMGVTAQLSVDTSWNVTDQELSDNSWSLTNQESVDPLWNTTYQGSLDRLWNMTDQESLDQSWNVTDQKSLDLFWNITDQEWLDPLVKITDQESLDPLWNTTDQESLDPLWSMTDQESLDQSWNITDQELSDPLWNITNQELLDPLLNITDQESPDPLRNITDHDSLVPLWNNDSHQCFLYTNTTNGVILFQGSSVHTCSLQVTASPGTRIQLQIQGRHVSQGPLFFYIERYGNFERCTNKYVVFNQQIEPCNSVLMHQNSLITIQSNVTLYIRKVPVKGIESKCAEEHDEVQGNDSVSQISDCNNVKGYNDTIRCYSQTTCSITFPQNCGAILGNREIVYEPREIVYEPREKWETCYYNLPLNLTHSAMIIYPAHTQTLFLIGNNIINLEVNAFQSLIYLEYLYLYSNRLRELDADLFLHLSLLKGLGLGGNKLQRLSPNIFHNLMNLEWLDLVDNELRELDADLFLHLSMLKHLYLQHNMLQRLPPMIFHNLINLEWLSLDYNELRELDADLFLHLSMLKHLYLQHNMLQRLPPMIFHNLINLEWLSLDYNELRELDADLFLHLSLLKELDLYHNMLQRLPPMIFHNLIKLEGLSLSNNELNELDDNVFPNLTNLEILFLSRNKLSLLPDEVFQGLLNLVHLVLDCLSCNHPTRNNVSLTLTTGLFNGLNNLQTLQLYNNRLVKLPIGTLAGLHSLKVFFANASQLESIEADAFQGLWNLIYLQLSTNSLTQLDHGLFKDTVSLAFLDLSHNQLKAIPTIQHLTHLYFFDVTNNPLTWISHDSFSSDSTSLNLFVNPQDVCVCYVPNHVNCSATDDRSPYLTCDRLLSTEALVVVMWLLGLNAFGGNLFVLFWRHKGTQTNKTNSMLLQNLAASDLLMGIYMLITASADSYYGDNFPMQSETWRSGIACRIAGAMSITSSEASVFFVMLISIDRFISIRFPFSTCKLGKMTARVIIIVTWMIAIVLGIVPSVLSGSSFEFYDNSHVCIGLPLALTKTYNNEANQILLSAQIRKSVFWEFVDVIIPREKGLNNGNFFSTAIFLGLNCVCYLIVLGCYIEIVRDVRKSSKRAGRSQERKEQIRLTTKVTAIVATDFCCWFPIIILGILVQTRVIELPPSVYAWCVTFVLPINSAINPYLYTIAEIVSSYRKKQSRRTDRQNIQLNQK